MIRNYCLVKSIYYKMYVPVRPSAPRIQVNANSMLLLYNSRIENDFSKKRKPNLEFHLKPDKGMAGIFSTSSVSKKLPWTLFTMKITKYLKVITALVLICLCGGLLVLWGTGPVSLNPLRGAIASYLSDESFRKVKLDGDLDLGISPHPYIEFHDLKFFTSLEEGGTPLLQLDSGRIGIRVLPLLIGQLRLGSVLLEGGKLDLRRGADGMGNWLAQQEQNGVNRQAPRKTADEVVNGSGESPPGGGRLVVDEIRLQDIRVVYHLPSGAGEEIVHIDRWNGSLPAREPLFTSGNGRLLDRPFEVTLEIASFSEFLRDNATWVRARLSLAGSILNMDGRLDLDPEKSKLDLGLSLSGQDLSTLSFLAGLDLPPIKEYQMRGKLRLTDGLVTLQDLNLRSKRSSLAGTMAIGKNGERRVLRAELRSPMIQLDDFLFEEWSWIDEASVADTSVDKTSESPKRLFSPEALVMGDAKISLAIDQVYSGQDELGRGQLQLNIFDGALRIDPLALDLPGGSILAKLMLAPDGEKLSGKIRVKMENFDLGIWARRKDPNTKMGGKVSLDMDITGSGGSLREVMDHSSGYLDFSGKLSNIESGGVDLWAVNLVRTALFATVDQKSYINCGVGRWSAKNGILKPDMFFVDTSGIRICGTGVVDLKEKKVDMLFSPIAKKAQFYSIAAPVTVKGGFDDIAVRLSKSELVGTTLTLMTSPIHVPLRWIFEHPIPADGRDACFMELGPSGRDHQVRGCFRENEN